MRYTQLRGALLGAAVAVTLLAMGPVAWAAGQGALAYRADSGRTGQAVNKATAADARKAALASCGRGCRVVAVFPKCAAVAWDPRSKRWGWSRGKSDADAKRWALQRCRDHGGRTCRVRAVACNR